MQSVNSAFSISGSSALRKDESLLNVMRPILTALSTTPLLFTKLSARIFFTMSCSVTVLTSLHLHKDIHYLVKLFLGLDLFTQEIFLCQIIILNVSNGAAHSFQLVFNSLKVAFVSLFVKCRKAAGQEKSDNAQQTCYYRHVYLGAHSVSSKKIVYSQILLSNYTLFVGNSPLKWFNT
nr:MAG TPA: hypothetical protein [Caudoviricetes sp.]